MGKRTDSYEQLEKEIVIFLSFFGVLICIWGYYTLTGLRGNPYSILGFPRNLALSIPKFVIGGFHIFCGVALGLTSNRLFATLGAVAGTVLAALFFIFMVSQLGRIPINLLSATVAAIPVLLWVRVSLFLKATRG